MQGKIKIHSVQCGVRTTELNKTRGAKCCELNPVPPKRYVEVLMSNTYKYESYLEIGSYKCNGVKVRLYLARVGPNTILYGVLIRTGERDTDT